VLIDVCMPDLDGFELAGDDPRTSAVPETAIILSRRSRSLISICCAAMRPAPSINGPVPGGSDLLAPRSGFCRALSQDPAARGPECRVERRVAERTAELAQTNADLEHRVEEARPSAKRRWRRCHEMQKVESLGQLTGGVAARFQQFADGVLGNLEILRKYIPDDVKLLRLRRRHPGSGARRYLTKRMLAFARRQELQPATGDVPPAVDSMVENAEPIARPGRRDHHPFEDVSGGAGSDPNRSSWRFLNLASCARCHAARRNADDFGASGVGRGERRPRAEAGEYICIAEQDTGVGMEETPSSERRSRSSRQGARARDRSRAVDGRWPRRTIRRSNADHEQVRRGHHDRAVAAVAD